MTELQRRAFLMLQAWEHAVETIDGQYTNNERNHRWRIWSRAAVNLDNYAGRHIEVHEARAIVGNDVATELLSTHELS